jgi:hypothetical protein
VEISYLKDSITYVHKYIADVTKQPMTIDFINKNNKVIPGFFVFYGDAGLRIESFPDNNRGTHFTTFGYNVFLKKSE